MNERDYLEWLEKIERLIGQKHLKQAQEMLRELEPIRPVRLKWYMAKAKLLGAQGKWADAARLLKDTCDWFGEAPEKEEYLTLLRRCHESARQKDEANWVRLAQLWQQDEEAAHCELEQEELSLIKLEEAFLEAPEKKETLCALYRGYLSRRMLTQATIFRALMTRRGFAPENTGSEAYLRGKNRAYLSHWLEKDNAVFFLFAHEEGLCDSAAAVTAALCLLGKKVCWIGEAVSCELESPAMLAQTVPVSMENAEDKGAAMLYRPVAAQFPDGMRANSETLLIHELSRPFEAAFLLAQNEYLEKLAYHTPAWRGQIWRLSVYEDPFTEAQLGFAALGSYAEYKSAFYGFDVAKALEAPPVCDFSIVIPARDSAATLKDTLHTCFDQTYTGSWEVVVSDNSVQNDEVEKLCREYGDDRLRYYRTPLPLALSASFEYAVLQARGEFILAIGSDDGMLPWALEYLAASMRKLPQEDIFFWNRGLYVWPDYINPAQRNQLAIPMGDPGSEVKVKKYRCKDILKQILNEPEYIYSMPLLYINSGFRRRYFKTLLARTGHLWNGTSQDVYMGLQNMALYDVIHQLGLPLTVAGMSSMSIGGNESAGTSRYRGDNSVGELHLSEKEREIPVTTNDQRLVYSSALRLIVEGVLEEGWEEEISMENAFLRMIGQLSSKDALFERYLWRVVAGMKRKAPGLIKRTEEEFLPKLFTPSLPQQEDGVARCYTVGYIKNEGLMLDASDFGVENIIQAVSLTEKILRGARKNKNLS